MTVSVSPSEHIPLIRGQILTLDIVETTENRSRYPVEERSGMGMEVEDGETETEIQYVDPLVDLQRIYKARAGP